MRIAQLEVVNICVLLFPFLLKAGLQDPDPETFRSRGPGL